MEKIYFQVLFDDYMKLDLLILEDVRGNGPSDDGESWETSRFDPNRAEFLVKFTAASLTGAENEFPVLVQET